MAAAKSAEPRKLSALKVLIASVRSVVSGTAPLAPEDADAFFAKYGVPVLSTYAATEFGGSVQIHIVEAGAAQRGHSGSAGG